MKQVTQPGADNPRYIKCSTNEKLIQYSGHAWVGKAIVTLTADNKMNANGQ